MRKSFGWLIRLSGAAALGICVALMLQTDTVTGCLIEAALYYCILFFAYRYGAGTGAVAGTLCGIVFSLLKNDVAALGILCLVGTAAGAFKRLGRYACVTGFMAAAALAGLIYSPEIFNQIIVRLIAASAFFLVTPQSVLDAWMTGPKRTSENDYLSKEQVFTERLKDMSRIMGDVVNYITYTGNNPAVSPATTAAVMCTISNIICEDCRDCPMGCAQKELDSVMLENITRLYEEHGRIEKDDIEGFFNASCANKDIYISELNAGLGSIVERKEWEHHYSESRNMIASGYKEMEGFLEKMADDFMNMNDFTAEAAEPILDNIGKRLIVKELAAIEGPYGREVYMTTATKGRDCETARGIATRVGKALNGRFIPSNDSPPVVGRIPVKLKFVEDAEYMILYGVARERKKGESVSGDSFAVMSLMGQKMFLGLSDGMGSGKNAAQHSKIAIGMAEKLLENGFSAEQVSRTVNSVLLMHEDDQPTTVDIGVIDMINAQLKIVKLGAPPVFIRRKNRVEVIYAPSLPAGVINDFAGKVIDYKLRDGDIIIMMTDGVLDAIDDIDKEGVMKDIILDIDSDNPRDIAAKILELLKPADGAADDMTVLAAGIWKR